jgi:hypothetical protein
MDGAAPSGSYTPGDLEVEALILAATNHPLGTQFLIGGCLGTVAITFHVHSFTVEAARRRLCAHTEGH